MAKKVESKKSEVCGTEYVELHTWSTVGRPKSFFIYRYVVNEGVYNPENTFRTVAKTIEECRARLSSWAEKKKYSASIAETIKVSAQ